jgi:trans-aconitate 2-methyltransferase
VGLDNSPEMIEEAQKAYPGVTFLKADASDFHFEEPFDAVFSNAALHWVKRSEEAAECVSRCLKPGGRFVAEFGGKGNIGRIRSALNVALNAEGISTDEIDPWYFPSIGEYASLLESKGLTPVSMGLFDRPTRLNDGEDGLKSWLAIFAHTFLDAVPIDKRPVVVQNMERELRPFLYRDNAWHVDYRRLRLVAVKDR